MKAAMPNLRTRSLSIILSTCRSGGTASLYLIGYTSCMDLGPSLNAKYAATIHIGGDEPLKGTFRNGDTPLECDASKYRTRSISRK